MSSDSISAAARRSAERRRAQSAQARPDATATEPPKIKMPDGLSGELSDERAAEYPTEGGSAAEHPSSAVTEESAADDVTVPKYTIAFVETGWMLANGKTAPVDKQLDYSEMMDDLGGGEGEADGWDDGTDFRTAFNSSSRQLELIVTDSDGATTVVHQAEAPVWSCWNKVDKYPKNSVHQKDKQWCEREDKSRVRFFDRETTIVLSEDPKSSRHIFRVLSFEGAGSYAQAYCVCKLAKPDELFCLRIVEPISFERCLARHNRWPLAMREHLATQMYENRRKNHKREFERMGMPVLQRASKQTNFLLSLEGIMDAPGAFGELEFAGLLLSHFYAPTAPAGQLTTSINLLEMGGYAPYHFPEKIARRLIYDVLEGLHHLHSKHRVCHRDIKPDNIVLDSRYRPVLVDLGNAKPLPRQVKDAPALSTDDMTRNWEQSLRGGSGAFNAPECVFVSPPEGEFGDSLDAFAYDPTRSDLWAVAVTYLQIRTFKLPWDDPSRPGSKYFVMDECEVVGGKSVLKLDIMWERVRAATKDHPIAHLSAAEKEMLSRVFKILPAERCSLLQFKKAMAGLDGTAMATVEQLKVAMKQRRFGAGK